MAEPIEESLAAELGETGPSQVDTEPIAVKVTRYRCPHCSRGWSKKAPAVAHIGRCWLNPEARACKTCVHFQPHHWTSEAAPEIAQALGADQAVACAEHEETCQARVDISLGLRVGCPLWTRKDPA